VVFWLGEFMKIHVLFTAIFLAFVWICSSARVVQAASSIPSCFVLCYQDKSIIPCGAQCPQIIKSSRRLCQSRCCKVKKSSSVVVSSISSVIKIGRAHV
jgi:hypothetical protein